MTSFLDQLNLTPQERRIVVGIAAVVFLVLNWLLVWPQFKDLSRVRKELDETRDTMVKWNKEISLDQAPTTNGYQNVLKTLERQQGGGIVNQQIQLQRTVSDQAIKTGVNVDSISPVNSLHADANKFYEEQSVKITFSCQEVQLVNFLVNVGNDAAMIRVRELNLKTADANRYGLRGDAILSANYAKQPAKPVPSTAPASGPRTPTPGNKSVTVPTLPLNPRVAPGAQPSRRNP